MIKLEHAHIEEQSNIEVRTSFESVKCAMASDVKNPQRFGTSWRWQQVRGSSLEAVTGRHELCQLRGLERPGDDPLILNLTATPGVLPALSGSNI
jgi:hypothetical protein